MTAASEAVAEPISPVEIVRSVGKRTALLIPPAIPGSLGDAAMLSGSTRFLRSSGVDSVDLAFGKAWPLDEHIDQHVSAERYFYRGSWLQRLLLSAKLRRYSEVYFVGADVIDGAYNPRSVRGRLSLLAEAAQMGKKAILLGSSYNEQPEATTRSTLRNMPEGVVICARDPVSRARMEWALERPIRQVADLAFLLKPLPDDPIALAASEWISIRRRAGDQIVGLNANYLHAEKDGRIPQALLALLDELLKANISIVLVPHDTRSKLPDERLLSDAASQLPKHLNERIYLLPPKSPGVIKAVLSGIDLLISGRMHAAILAMSSGTPAFCFAYQDKFEGLFSFFDLESDGLLSSPKHLAERPNLVAGLALTELARHASLRTKILARLPQVTKLSEQNFA